MTRNACSLCLNSLCSSYLQSLGCGIRVQCHILCLEGSGLITVVPEDAAEGSGHDAFAYIAACTCEHDGMEWFHIG